MRSRSKKRPTYVQVIRQFAAHLGQHDHQDAERTQLTLPELGALVVVAGRTAGFTVKTEERCLGGRIDCAWFRGTSKRPVVAWELDARDVGRGHLAGTFQKLRRFARATKIQALYTIRGGVKRKQRYLEELRPRGIRLHTDEELIGGELETIVKQARAASRRSARSRTHARKRPARSRRSRSALRIR